MAPNSVKHFRPVNCCRIEHDFFTIGYMGELCLNIVLNMFRKKKKERKIHIKIFGCVEGKREERKKEKHV